jgi:hypothetical protein
MLARDRSRFPVHAPIDPHRRPPAGPTNSAKAESDRGACLCPSATGPRNESAFCFNHFCRPCNHPNVSHVDIREEFSKSSNLKFF